MTRVYLAGGTHVDLAITPREVDRILGAALQQGAIIVQLPQLAGTVYISIPQITHWGDKALERTEDQK